MTNEWVIASKGIASGSLQTFLHTYHEKTAGVNMTPDFGNVLRRLLLTNQSHGADDSLQAFIQFTGLHLLAFSSTIGCHTKERSIQAICNCDLFNHGTQLFLEELSRFATFNDKRSL